MTVHIGFGPASGAAPLTVHLVGLATGGSGLYTAYYWDFGDGDRGAGRVLNYTYGDPGNYTITLNVTDSQGAIGHDAVNVSVDPVARAGPAPPDYLPYYVLIAAVGAGSAGLAGYLWTRRREGGTESDEVPAGATEDPPTETEAESVPAAYPPVEVASTAPVVSEAFPGATTVPVDTLRLSQRIILHLASQAALGPEDLGTIAHTQPGMGAALGAGQSAVSNVLQRLVAAGVVASRTRHVTGRPRRLRVYTLTPYGYRLAGDLRRRNSPPK